MASWTLWQPLIPRYQLTTKEITIEDANPRPKSSPSSPRKDKENPSNQKASRSRHTKSSKGVRSSQSRNPEKTNGHTPTPNPEIQYQNITNDERGGLQRGKATMYFTMASPIVSARNGDTNKGVVMKPSFPVRKSPYIDTLKQQQRINSARQSSEDPSTASPRHKMSPRLRNHKSVSQFPVTQIDQQEMANYYNDRQRPKTAASRTPSLRIEASTPQTSNRTMCKSAGAARNHKNISVNSLDFSESSPRPFLKNPLYREPTSPRRYAVRKLDDATMFIDDDKIIFIKKKTTKNDVLLSQNCTEEANYIKHLRRLYLREPKDFAKLIKEPEGKKGTTIRERLEYELKTDHILNYYSRVDDKQDATLWAMAVEESRKAQQAPQCTPRSTSGYRRVDSASGYRRTESARSRQGHNMSPPRSARSVDREKDRPVSARSLPYSNISSENLHMNHDSLSDWNVFLKFNTRSILHERQFYLQTPTTSMNDLMDNNTESNKTREASCDNHECRLCRLEKEMGGKSDTQATKEEASQKVGNHSKGILKNVFIETGIQSSHEEIRGSDDSEIKKAVCPVERLEPVENSENAKDLEAKVRTVSTSTWDLGGVETVKDETSENVEQNQKLDNNNSVNIPNGEADNVNVPNTTGSLNETYNNETSSIPTESYSPIILPPNECIDKSTTEVAAKELSIHQLDERGQLASK